MDITATSQHFNSLKSRMNFRGRGLTIFWSSTIDADEQNNPESGKASEADKSALAAINRALRMAGLFRERAYMARLRAIPFKYVHESRRGRWRAWRGQASPLHIRHDRSVKRDGVAKASLAPPFDPHT